MDVEAGDVPAVEHLAEPHTAIVGENQGVIMNLVDAQAKPAQTATLDIAHENSETTLHAARHLRLPRHHEVRAENLNLKRLGAVLAVAYERDSVTTALITAPQQEH